MILRKTGASSAPYGRTLWRSVKTEELTWCSLRDILIPGTTTFLSSSMSAKIHSSRTEEMRKSPLNNAWSP